MSGLSCNRVQVSLIFRDDDVYRLVQQYKQNRALNDLIIQCLTTFCNNAEVRRIITNEAQQGYTEVVNRSVSESQEICDNIRNALAMQSYYASELKQTLEDGADEIADILNASNEMAQDSGVAKSHRSDFGSTMYRLELHSDFVKDAVARVASDKCDGVEVSTGTLGVLFKRLFSNMHDDEGVRMVDQLLGDDVGVHASRGYVADGGEGVSSDSDGRGEGAVGAHRGHAVESGGFSTSGDIDIRSGSRSQSNNGVDTSDVTNVVNFQQGLRCDESTLTSSDTRESVSTMQGGIHQDGDATRSSPTSKGGVFVKDHANTDYIGEVPMDTSSQAIGVKSDGDFDEEGSLGMQGKDNSVGEDASAGISDLMSSIF